MASQQRIKRWLALASVVPLLLALSAHVSTGHESSKRSSQIDFEREVQPILTRRCLLCHGPAKAAGGLRFTDRAAATAELKSGQHGIVPGKPEESEAIRRVTAEDANVRMPPKHEPLSSAEVTTLKQWIAEGADWPAHWAYQPLARPPVPQVTLAGFEKWPINAIDQFILEKLREKGLTPSQSADKRTLLRRLTFDLTGLPPTPEEMASFLADGSPDAYDKVVDRLLASPHYGERWARHWMDVVHFAETHGHDQDRPRLNAWPYRDYLIRSFNDDKPYARFVEEQIAGDVLYPDDPHAITATGFLAAGPWDESSLRDIREDSIDREIGRYLDRDDMVTTALGTFASASVQCARCHDHKFDPISQVDYYRLQSVFAGVDKADRAFDDDPKVAAMRRELAQRKNNLAGQKETKDAVLLTTDVQDQVAAWEKSRTAGMASWTVVKPTSAASTNGATLTTRADGSMLSNGKRPETDTYVVVASVGMAKITGVRLEVLTDESLPHKGPGRQDNGNLHLNEFKVATHSPGLSGQDQQLVLKNPRADFNQQGWSIDLTLDNKPATAWGIYPEVGKPHEAVFELSEPLNVVDGMALTFRLEQTHGGGHLIGRFRLSVTEADLPIHWDKDRPPDAIAKILATPADQRSDSQRIELAAYVLDQQIDHELAALPKQRMAYVASNQFKLDGSFKPTTQPRHVYVLKRGDVANPGEEVGPGTLSCVPGLASEFTGLPRNDEGHRRVALAKWLTDRKNVLTWRSIANRIWHYHFGMGIVGTPNDFGHVGAAPTHYELLDWLAVELQNSGSLKKLTKLIVMSATYRQAVRHEPRFAAIDADNRYLWRANRTRLDAESIRDAILLATGKLDDTMYGPSVQQFTMSPGLHVTPVVDYAAFDVDSPGSYRRSVYRFLFRTIPDPFMEALDCPDASQFTPVRSVSVTPTQALAMLNNKFVVRQSERLAARVAKEATDRDGQIKRAYELTLSRSPSEEELAAMKEYANKHGMANACRVLLNCNEFVFVN